MSVDEEWLFSTANVDQIVFGMLGGRFTSDEKMTAEVKALNTSNGALDRVQYAMLLEADDNSAEDGLGLVTDSIDNVLLEFSVVEMVASQTAEGLRIEPKVSGDQPDDEEPEGSGTRPPAGETFIAPAQSVFDKALRACKVVDMSVAYAGELFGIILNKAQPVKGMAKLAEAAVLIEEKIHSVGGSPTLCKLAKAERTGVLRDTAAKTIGRASDAGAAEIQGGAGASSRGRRQDTVDRSGRQEAQQVRAGWQRGARRRRNRLRRG